VSIAGNVGHIQPEPGHPVILADRLTAATSPVAAFAGLTVGLLVLKMTRQHRFARIPEPRVATTLVLAPPLATTSAAVYPEADGGPSAHLFYYADDATRHRSGTGPHSGLLRDATAIYRDAAAR
jgi:hypothetical protein